MFRFFGFSVQFSKTSSPSAENQYPSKGHLINIPSPHPSCQVFFLENSTGKFYQKALLGDLRGGALIYHILLCPSRGFRRFFVFFWINRVAFFWGEQLVITLTMILDIKCLICAGYNI